MTYTEALKELEIILENLRNGTVDIDQLESQTQRASELITWCRNRLKNVGDQLNDMTQKNGELF